MKQLRQNSNKKPNRLLRGLKSAFQLFIAFVFYMAQMQHTLAAIDNDARAVGVFNGSAVIAVSKSGVLNDDDGTPGLSAGDTISYTVTVTNPGNVSLTGINVTDPLLPLTLQSGDLDSDFRLDTDETWIYTGDYTVTSFDLATNGGGDGDIDNTVTVDSNETPPESATQQTPINPDVSILVDKVGTLNDDDGIAGVTAGDTIDYVITVQNNGVANLTNINVLDNLVQGVTSTPLVPIFTGGDTNSNSEIDAGEIWTYTFTYTLTPANIADGNDLVNTVLVTTDEIGPRDASDTQVIPGAINSFTMEKIVTLVDGDADNLGDAGETINYTFRFVNTGNRILTNLAVSDPLPGLSAILCANDGDSDGDIDALNPSQTLDCTASYIIQGSDAGNGSVDNTATPSATETGDETASNEVSISSGVSIDVAKTGVLNDDDGTPGVTAGDTIDYTIIVENDGSIDLTNVVLADTLVQNGTPTTLTPVFDSGDTNIDNAINPGETWTYLITYTLTPANIADGNNLVNTVDVTTDQIGPESATDTQVLSAPLDAYTMEKIATLNDGDADNLADSGEDINYTFRFVNTGTRALTNLTVTDPLPGLTTILCSNDGDSDGDIDLLPVGATLDCVAVYTVQNSDVLNGSVDNTATPSATAADGTTPVAEDDTPNDNSTSTPTDTNISLDINKTVASAVEVLPNVVDVEYLLELTNTDTVTLTNLTLEDDLAIAVSAPAQIVGTGSITVFSGFTGPGTSNGIYDGIGNNKLFSGDVQLAPAATGQVRILVRIDRRAQSVQTSNVAIVTSTEVPGPTPSDDPTDPTGNTDPTPFDRPDVDGDGAPDSNEPLGDRDGDGIPDSDDYDPTGYFYCEADGRILTGGSITVVNVFSGLSQSGVGSSNDITIIRDGADGSYQFYVSAPGTYRLVPTLPVGGVASTDRLSSGTLDVTSLLPANPGILGGGQVGATGVLDDFSEIGNPFFTEFVINIGDPSVFNNNIPMTFCGTPEITASKTVASGPTPQPDGTSNVTYLISAENSGTQQIDNVSLQDDLDAVFGAGNFTILSQAINSSPVGFGATIPLAFDGVANTDLLTAGGTLQPTEAVSILLELNVDVPAGSFTNTVDAGGDDALTGAPIPTDDCSVTIAISTIIPDGIIATKTTPVDAAPLGAVVPYTITFENTSGVPITVVDLVDFMPAGFSYVEGSAVVNGAPLEPTLVDWNLVWAGQNLAPGETITITFSLVIGAGITGAEFINTTVARDPSDNSDVSNRATAAIRLEIESVFQCSHIIGRVFDDLDSDGYYDDGEQVLAV